MEIHFPVLENRVFAQMLAKERIIAFGGGYSPDELEFIDQILSVVRSQAPEWCQKFGREGFSVSVAIGEKAIITTHIGSVPNKKDIILYGSDGKALKYSDYGRMKVESLQKSVKHIRSSECKSRIRTKIESKKPVGGAIKFKNGAILGVSGLSSNPFEDEAFVSLIGKKMGFREN